LNAFAGALAFVAAVVSLWPGTAEFIARISASPPGTRTIAISLELLVSALLAILVQWGLGRRGPLRIAGADGVSCWAWRATTAAGLRILNPIGLGLVWPLLQASMLEWLEDPAKPATAGALFALVVAGAIECYIRGRLLHRKLGLTP